MKQLVVSLLVFLSASIAYAQSDTGSLIGLGVSPEKAAQINKQYSTSIRATQLPKTDNSVDLGSASKQFRTAYIGTSIVNAGTASNAGLIAPTTAEEAVAGAGTTVADAAALSVSKHIHQLTGANGTVGWKFTTGLPVGSIEILLNTTAGVPKIYGESGSTCNGGAADAACTLLSGITVHICYKTAALTYICA